jgi:hypothetical protein
MPLQSPAAAGSIAPKAATLSWLATLGPLLVGVALTLAGGGILSAQQRGARSGLAASATGPVGEGGASPLWISAAPLDDGRQLVLIIDPQMRNAAVYHVDAASGSLTLRSTRNIAWDLLVPEYNAQEPRPATLKKMLEVGAEGVPAGQTRP